MEFLNCYSINTLAVKSTRRNISSKNIVMGNKIILVKFVINIIGNLRGLSLKFNKRRK